MSEEETTNQETPPRFQFVRALGRGVVGEAHEVIDEASGDPVVLKVFLRCVPRDSERFRLEFQSLARLEHPALARYFHLVDPRSDTNLALEERLGERGIAFTQEYVNGVDLLTWLRNPATSAELTTLETRRTPTTGDVPELDEIATGEVEREISEAHAAETGVVEVSTGELGDDEDVVSSIVEEIAGSSEPVDVPMDLVLFRLETVVPQLLGGLSYLHRFGKVHGSLRPSNILVDREGKLKLTDYGIEPDLAYCPNAESADGEPLVHAPENLPYLAPELTDAVVSAEADLYALGCVLYEAIAGQSPFETLELSAGRGGTLAPPPLAELVPGCPAVWADRIDALMHRDPAERPSLGSVEEIVAAEGRAVQLPPSVVDEPDRFVGQASILETIRETAAASAEDRTVRLVLLQGAAGTGKSTIVAEVSHLLARRGWSVLAGRCFDRESVPFQGWDEISERVALLCDALPAKAREGLQADRDVAMRLFPALGREQPPSEAPLSRSAAVRAFRRLLGALAAERPLLLALEDLHWASWDTTALLMDIFNETRSFPAIVLTTWRTDAPRTRQDFVTKELELSLVELQRLTVTGFTRDEAREFLVSRRADIELEQLQTILKKGRSNPRVLGELLWEVRNERPLPKGAGPDVLPSLYSARIDDLGRRERATMNLLAVSSGPLGHDVLHRAVESELAGSVLPAEATDESIDAGIEQLESANLLRVFEHPSGERDYLVGSGIVREAAIELLSERDRARLAGRIADALSEERVVPHDIRFEYELRAGRVGRALKSAVRATRNAEERFAYNRSAKLWRWIGDNADKLEDPTVRPDAELARVEHLAGQHAEAAELYNSWAATRKERTRLASIKRDEARAWLQAGQNDRAVEAIEAGFRAFGESYGRRWYSSFREVPTRWLATMDRWNPRIVEAAKVDTATPAQLCLAELYDFVLARAGWLYPERSGPIEARLGRLARSTGDALIVGRHRMRMAVLTAGPGHESSRERSLRWLDEAETLFERAGNLAGRSEVHLHRAILNIRYGEFETARQSLDLAAKTGRRAEDEQANDRRELFYWRAMYHVFVGDLEKAERLARQLLHVYRGDRLAASSAYRLLARIALDRGQTVLAEAFVAEGTRSMRATRPNLVTVLWAREETRLDIALGRPEVAVGRLEILREALQKHGLAGHAIFEVPLHVAMGQALSAVYERDRVLGDSHVDQTNARMRVIARRVSKGLPALGALRRAEAHRLLARAELMAGRARKALKHADLAIEALGAIPAPSQVALCAEVRGRVLAALERPDARGIIEQARHMYTHYGIAHPLVLEGWPVPREVSMLKDDQ